jgi:hypothetical protein
VRRRRRRGGVSHGQRTALRKPNKKKKIASENGHVLSFSGSYHDEVCILTSVIASASIVSVGTDEAEVIEAEVENGGGGDEVGREMGAVVIVVDE